MDSGVDPARARRNQARRAAQLGSHAQLPLELGRRLLEHLDGLRVTPQRVLALGGVLLHETLSSQFPQAELLHAEGAAGCFAALPPVSRLRQWLGGRTARTLCCSPEALPLRNGSVDLVVAHGVLALHSPQRCFSEARRVLRQDGLLLFSTLGPDTLQEWRRSLGAARPRWPEPLEHAVIRLADMHDIADMAAEAGLSSPVVDMEHLTVHYPDLATLLADLRVLGGGNALKARQRGLMTPRAYQRLKQVLEHSRQAEGLPQTLEVIYGHAWNTRPLVDAAGRPVIPIRAAGPR